MRGSLSRPISPAPLPDPTTLSAVPDRKLTKSRKFLCDFCWCDFVGSVILVGLIFGVVIFAGVIFVGVFLLL